MKVKLVLPRRRSSQNTLLDIRRFVPCLPPTTSFQSLKHTKNTLIRELSLFRLSCNNFSFNSFRRKKSNKIVQPSRQRQYNVAGLPLRAVMCNFERHIHKPTHTRICTCKLARRQFVGHPSSP